MNSLWQSGALGRMTIASEAQLLGRALEGVFGPVLLQLGHWGEGKELWPQGPQRRPQLIAPQPGAGTDAVARFSLSAPDGLLFGTGGGTGSAESINISPDAKALSFIGQTASGTAVWLRPLDVVDARPPLRSARSPLRRRVQPVPAILETPVSDRRGF